VTTTPPVHVVVVSYGTADLLDAGLGALRPDADAGLVTVTVVDNGSTDGSQALVRERHPWVTLLEPPANLGFGAAVNLAVREAGPHAWVAPANADTAVTPGSIEALLAAGAADPQAGVVAPRLLLPDGSTQHSVFAFPRLGFTVGFHLRLGDRRPDWGREHCLPGRWDPDAARRVPWAVGAFLLVRREAWDAVDGFDETQWMYAEDVDLGWRLAQAGWATRYVPEAAVHHQESAAALAAWGAEGKADRWNRATYAWMHRRFGGPRARAIALANVAGHGLWSWRALRRRSVPREERAAELALHRAWARRHAIGLLPSGRIGQPERPAARSASSGGSSPGGPK
jgi:N-acetylglucosaminyl-diphospho-decaprenol L-rhamnosyltransferase